MRSKKKPFSDRWKIVEKKSGGERQGLFIILHWKKPV